MFEFDEAKSLANLGTHGIDFVQAQQLWNDPNRIEVPARTSNERRVLVISMIGDKHWSAVVTPRGNNIRIISVRRSRTEEIMLYES